MERCFFILCVSLLSTPKEQINFDLSNPFITFEELSITNGAIRSQHPCTDFLLEFSDNIPFVLGLDRNGSGVFTTRSWYLAAGNKGVFYFKIMLSTNNSNTLFYTIYSCVKTDRSILSNESFFKAREDNGEEYDLFNLICKNAGVDFDLNFSLRKEYMRIISQDNSIEDATYQLLGVLSIQSKPDML